MQKLEHRQSYELSPNLVNKLIADGWQTNVVTMEFKPAHKGIVIDGQCEVVSNEIDVMELIELFIADVECQAMPHLDDAFYSEKSIRASLSDVHSKQ